MTSFKLPPNFFEELDNSKPLTMLEGYYLTGFYVTNFLVKGQFRPLVSKCEPIDLIDDLYKKFVEQNLFGKYNPEITSKKYHVMLSVKRSLIDKLRRHRDEVSLDLPVGDDGEGVCVLDFIPDVGASKIGGKSGGVSYSQSVEDQARYDELLQSLMNKVSGETESKLQGVSPLFGVTVNFSPRTILIHTVHGMSPAEIGGMFVNPRSGRPVSTSHVTQILNKVREELMPVMVEILRDTGLHQLADHLIVRVVGED